MSRDGPVLFRFLAHRPLRSQPLAACVWARAIQLPADQLATMMVEVGAFEAKTHLSQLLDQIERGESVVITRHGRQLARLVPMRGSSIEDRRRAIEGVAPRADARWPVGSRADYLGEAGSPRLGLELLGA